MTLTKNAVLGDCGSWVVDTNTGEWFGHIIAQDTGAATAYLVPAEAIQSDIISKFGTTFELNPDYSSGKFCIKSPSTPDPALAPIRQVSHGLTFACSNFTVRNDTKPENITTDPSQALPTDLSSLSRSAQLSKTRAKQVFTSLQDAAAGGHLDVVEELLTAKADVDAAAAAGGCRGQTALQAASQSGHLAMVDRLLLAGANVNAAAAAGFGGRTALQAASEGGHLAVVDRLLVAGADVNAAAAGRYGRTALQAASEGGHLAAVDRLLVAGSDVNTAADRFGGRTALQAASKGGGTAVQAASKGGHLDKKVRKA